jgi:two-component system, OmpR family, response regulator
MSDPRVLVVDDDAELRTLIGDYLASNGMSVAVAGDAKAMDAALNADKFDLVVLDLMMPGEDGLSVLRRMQRAERPAIIMLSAMGEDSDRIIGLEVGADDYLAKPCNPRELLARVRAVLRRREVPHSECVSRPAAARADPRPADRFRQRQRQRSLRPRHRRHDQPLAQEAG